jgi:hypothetical protein
MPEMRQRVTDSYREIRGESGAAVLELLDFPQVPNDAEFLRGRTMKRSKTVRAETKTVPFSVWDALLQNIDTS